jgi:putative hydrolase of the HAD superfamily
MLPRPRAVIFDLDDTLYPVRRFRRSAWAAVAEHLERTRGLDRVRSLRVLTGIIDGTRRGQELQVLLDAWRQPQELLSELLGVFRAHHPHLPLPDVSKHVLMSLRPEWKLGILTNGFAPVQGRKVRALGVDRLVDAVVYAVEHGGGLGKPEPAPFQAILARLGVEASHTVFVGDDEWCDIGGARRLGMRTVRLTAWTGFSGESRADAVIHSLAELPALVESLLTKGSVSDAA